MEAQLPEVSRGHRGTRGAAFGWRPTSRPSRWGWTTTAAGTLARGQMDAQGGTVAPLACRCPEVPTSRRGRGALPQSLRCSRPGDTAVSGPRALLKSLPKSGLGANRDGMGPSSGGKRPFAGVLAGSAPTWGDSWPSCQHLQPPAFLSFHSLLPGEPGPPPGMC